MDNAKVNKRTIVMVLLFFGLMVILGGLRTTVTFITDYQWFSKNGYIQTFLVEILTKLKNCDPTLDYRLHRPTDLPDKTQKEIL